MRRLIGLVMLLTGLTGACVGALGVVVSGPTVASAGREVDSLLAATSTTLTNTRQSLLVLKAALADLEDSAVTFESSAQESDRGLAQTQEVLDQAARITGQELPQSLDAVKRGIDSAAKPAAAMEAVMVAITNTPPFSTALAQAGVTYRPEVSLATSLQNTAAGLDAASARVRALGPSLAVARESATQLRTGNAQTAADAARLRESLVRLQRLTDGFVTDLDGTQASVRRAREATREQVPIVTLLALGASCWFALAQLPALYLGWHLLRGRRVFGE